MKVDNIPLSPEEELLWEKWQKGVRENSSNELSIEFFKAIIRNRRKEKQ